jgi:hypothetical protein
MMLSTCCSYASVTAYELCPDCKEHCDWETIDDEEWESRDEADNQLEQININKNN